MWGSETLAMLVSNTSMNVAMVTTSAMIHGLTSGRVYAGRAGSATAASVIVSKGSVPLYLVAERHAGVTRGLDSSLVRAQFLRLPPHLMRVGRAEIYTISLCQILIGRIFWNWILGQNPLFIRLIQII
jgi:hypothetical protein